VRSPKKRKRMFCGYVAAFGDLGKSLRLLFDLDQTIQELTVERGLEDPACVRLTGIYHNLIRYWADA
jgi:predicted 2-oxoglutarate/Fe(II)-dependent dioxygenase YbiX